MDFPEFYPWLQGERIFDVLGRVVVKRAATDGSGFEAVKASHQDCLREGEARMLEYAVQCAGVKGPKLRRLDTVDNARLMVTDFIPGVPLDTVWLSLNNTDKASIKLQLQQQIRLLRAHENPFIGRVGADATFPDPYRPFTAEVCGPFKDESAFDRHKIDKLQIRSVSAAKELETSLDKLRGTDSEKFVLTHGDLNSRNIHVQRVNEKGSRPIPTKFISRLTKG
jgi:hypothetical protein